MRRLIVSVAALLLLFGGAVPAQASHGDAVDGVWRATDLDGSKMILEITEHEGNTGYFTVVWKDSRAAGACSPAARWEAVTTTALFGPRTDEPTSALFADFSDIRCYGNSTSNLPDGFQYEWDVIVDNEIMVDLYGVVWYHIRG